MEGFKYSFEGYALLIFMYGKHLLFLLSSPTTNSVTKKRMANTEM
jgi:hypothetical protein